VTFDRSSDWGYLLPSSADSLRHVIAEMNSGEFQINLEEGPIESKGTQKMKMIHALSYSSAFWASGLMSNYMMNMFFNKMLITRSTSDLIESSFTEKSDVIMMDGGVIDTTGIVGLLKRKKDHIGKSLCVMTITSYYYRRYSITVSYDICFGSISGVLQQQCAIDINIITYCLPFWCQWHY